MLPWNDFQQAGGDIGIVGVVIWEQVNGVARRCRQWDESNEMGHELDTL